MLLSSDLVFPIPPPRRDCEWKTWRKLVRRLILGRTWAGQSYETDDGVPSGDVDEVQLQGSSVAVAASEVVLLCFK